MVVIRNPDQSLTTDWYAKPIASGRMLNFNSFHQMKHKLNVANNFIHRVLSLSTHSSWEHQKNTIYTHLQSNAYPKTLISRLIQRYRNQQQHPEVHHPIVLQPGPSTIQGPHPVPHTHSDLSDMIYRSIPYVPHLTERIQKIFRPEYTTVSITSRQTSTVKNLHSVVKDPKIPLEKSKIIYNIPCNNCEKCYIGMTRNKLSTRLAGHKTDVNKLENILLTQTSLNCNSLSEKTALIQHCYESGHRFNLEKTKIVDNTFHSHTLPFLEMCHIYNTPNTVNRRVDVEGLNTTYSAILHNVKSHMNTRPSHSNDNSQHQNDNAQNQNQDQTPYNCSTHSNSQPPQN